MENKVLVISVLGFIYSSNNLDTDFIVGYLRKKQVKADVFYVERDSLKKDIEALYKRSDYDIYIIYMQYDNVKLCFTICDQIKSFNAKAIICFVGELATICYKDIMQKCNSIDYIVLGDAEETIYNFILQGGNNCVQEWKNVVSHSSMDDKEAFYSLQFNGEYIDDYFNTHPYKINTSYNLITKNKGCSGNCTFCIANKRKNFSYSAVESIFQTICDKKKKLKITHFNFLDENLFDVPIKEAKERIGKLCDLLISEKVEITISFLMRADSFFDTKEDNILLNKMYRAGFIQGSFGAESGYEEDLKLYGKGHTVRDIERSFILLKRHKIEPQVGFIFFNPYSTLKSLKENYNILQKYQSGGVYRFAATHLSLYKNTPLYRKVERDKLLKTPYNFLDDFDYNYKSVIIGKIADFLRMSFGYDSKIWSMESADSLILFYNQLFRYSSYHDFYKNKVDILSKKYSLLVSDYFAKLYLDNDIMACEKLLNEFQEKLLNISNEIIKLKKRLLIERIRELKKGEKNAN